MSKQLTIPGLELSSSPPKKPKVSTQEKIASLEKRVLSLELETTLIRLQLEDAKDHA